MAFLNVKLVHVARNTRLWLIALIQNGLYPATPNVVSLAFRCRVWLPMIATFSQRHRGVAIRKCEGADREEL
jgi:hypothetical protein